MIIVKTKNGDHFINEKSVIEVKHDREKATVSCYGANGYFSHHEDVEGVVYTNDAQPTSWTDEGSEIERLKKKLDEHMEWSRKLRDEYMKIEQERDELKARVEELETRMAELKPAEDNSDNIMVLYEELDRLETAQRERDKKEHPNWGCYQKKGNACRFANTCKANDINTVAQLLDMGSQRFMSLKYIGRNVIEDVSKALDNIYGIKHW